MELRTGTSVVDITPRLGLELAGYPHFPRHNTGVHDPLYASCLFLEDGNTRLAVVGMDILFFSKKHVASVAATLKEEIGLEPSHLMICCSHSHSTPWAAGRLDMDSLLEGVKQDPPLIEELCSKLVHLVVSASRTTFPCEVGFAAQHCGKEKNIGGNRRDPEHGPSDPTVYVLAVRQADREGRPVRCILANYAVHPTLLHADNTLVSADYPGAMREYLREKYPAANLVFSLGPSGDQSTRYFRSGQTFQEAKRYGYTLGEAAARAIAGMRFESGLTLSARSTQAKIHLRNLPDEQSARRHVEERQAAYNSLIAENAPYIDIQNANVALLGAEDILGYVLMEKEGLAIELVEDDLPPSLHLFRIGEHHIASFPGEIFQGISQYLRCETGLGQLIVSTVTNGVLPGYVYTREEAETGGYEVDTSMLNVEAGYRMADAIAGLLNQGDDYGADRH